MSDGIVAAVMGAIWVRGLDSGLVFGLECVGDGNGKEC